MGKPIFNLPARLSRLSLRRPGTRFLTLVILVVLLVIYAAGGFFVYRRPDTGVATKFARVLPYSAALVGKRIVWANEIFFQERYTKTYGAKTNQVIPEPPRIREEVLDNLIELKLVAAETSRYKVAVSKDEINASFETIAAENGGREQILSILRELYGMNEKEFKSLIADQLLVDKLKKEVLLSVSVRHILLKDQKKAEELAGKAKAGEDFAVLAKEFSEDTGSRDAGGSLGFVSRGATVKPFEDVAFALQHGQISDPVQSEFGWHVIKVEERKGTIDKSYADWLAEAKSKTRIVKLLKR